MEQSQPLELPNVTLRSFLSTDSERFYEMVNDTHIKDFIEELDAPKQQVLSKFHGLNDNIYYHQYWGVFKPDGTLIGFVSLRKNKSIYKALIAKDQPIQESGELVLPTDEEVEENEWLAIVKAPYAIDVVIHREYRKQGFAIAAIRKIIEYAGSTGMKKVYFEVSDKNEQSRKMLQPLNCTSVIPAAEHYGHEVFEYQYIPQKLTTAEVVQELNLIKPDEDGGLLIFGGKWPAVFQT